MKTRYARSNDKRSHHHDKKGEKKVEGKGYIYTTSEIQIFVGKRTMMLKVFINALCRLSWRISANIDRPSLREAPAQKAV